RLLQWDVPGKTRRLVSSNFLGVHAIAALRDGRIISCGDGLVLMWDSAVEQAGAVELGSHDGWVTTVSVLPDGRVVTGGDDGRVRLWDPSMALSQRAEPGGYTNLVTALAPSRRGILSGG